MGGFDIKVVSDKMAAVDDLSTKNVKDIVDIIAAFGDENEIKGTDFAAKRGAFGVNGEKAPPPPDVETPAKDASGADKPASGASVAAAVANAGPDASQGGTAQASGETP